MQRGQSNTKMTFSVFTAKCFLRLRWYSRRFWNAVEHKGLSANYVSTGERAPAIRVENGASIQNPKDKAHLVRLGSEALIDGMLSTFGGKGTIEIGDMSYVGPNTRIWALGQVKIGSNVLIAHNTNIFDSQTHPTDATIRRNDYANLLRGGGCNANNDINSEPVILEDDVWVGCNCCIMRGVTIGARSIVAMGSVVTKSVPPDVMVAGNPARIIKSLKDDGDSDSDRATAGENKEVF